VVLGWAASALWVTHAQQPPTQSGTAPYTFTGKSWRIEPKDVSVTARGFESGARTDWHTHNSAQLLFVREGRMRYQVRGQKMSEVPLHGTAYLPASVPHWHGATPGAALSHLSITFESGATWMEKVTDAQYAGK
jgi:quercetin dioxygenase-like cupin family protein